MEPSLQAQVPSGSVVKKNIKKYYFHLLVTSSDPAGPVFSDHCIQLVLFTLWVEVGLLFFIAIIIIIIIADHNLRMDRGKVASTFQAFNLSSHPRCGAERTRIG